MRRSRLISASSSGSASISRCQGFSAPDGAATKARRHECPPNIVHHTRFGLALGISDLSSKVLDPDSGTRNRPVEPFGKVRGLDSADGNVWGFGVVSIDTGVNGVDPCRPVSTRVRGRIDSLYACHMS